MLTGGIKFRKKNIKKKEKKKKRKEKKRREKERKEKKRKGKERKKNLCHQGWSNHGKFSGTQRRGGSLRRRSQFRGYQDGLAQCSSTSTQNQRPCRAWGSRK